MGVSGVSPCLPFALAPPPDPSPFQGEGKYFW